MLASGHSIDAVEPIFGLTVIGIVNTTRMKKNSTAQAGLILFLTKQLGIGVLTTSEKKRQLRPEHQGLATEVMCQLNTPGVDFAQVVGITAIIDITGFGLLSHLSERYAKVLGYRGHTLWFERVPIGCRESKV